LRGLHLTILVMKEQQGLLREQDEELGKLGVQRVKALAGVMREELSEQTVMLEEFEDDVDKADSNMHSLQKRLRGLVDDAKSSDRALWSVIGCLVIVLLVLTFMVLS
jgi:t-SNARE complex subunit (syntaxin)